MWVHMVTADEYMVSLTIVHCTKSPITNSCHLMHFFWYLDEPLVECLVGSNFPFFLSICTYLR